MATAQSSTLIYRLITWALSPVAFIHTAYVAFKNKRLGYLLNRYAFYKSNPKLNQPIWCHCASVGEINTALPLLKALTMQGETLVITTNTVTGHDTLAQAKLNNSAHAYLPLDYASFAKRFIRNFQPKHCLVFETELWPNILLTTMRHDINVAIVNGRISAKTLNAPVFILKNYSRILSNIQRVISSSEENTSRFISLGAKHQSITTLDNLKFAQSNSPDIQHHEAPLTFPFLLCASTHEGEEQRIINAWRKIPHAQLGLVIALRHPQRINEVTRILEHYKLDYCLHSNSTSTPNKDTIYVIDTLGDLQPFIAHANIVFMGGSLVPIGGHNIIEPACYKRCILIGPHHANFQTIVDDLIAHQAIEIVNTAEELIDKSYSYLSNDRKRNAIGENAYHYLQSKKQILSAFEKEISDLIQPNN